MVQNEVNSNERKDSAQDEMLATILSRLGGGSQGGAPPTTQGASSEPTAGASGSADILSSLLSNPELIAKLPTIIASIKPIIEILGKSGIGSNEAVSVASLPQKSEAVTVQAAKTDRGNPDSRTALLCAMKPYLGEDRRQAIDYIVKLGRLGEILKTL